MEAFTQVRGKPVSYRVAVVLAASLRVLAAAYTAAGRVAEPGGDGKIVQIPLSWSNAYLILGRRPVLVDPGSPSDADFERLESALSAYGYGIDELSLIIVTHGHADHAGGTSRVAQASGAPVLAGAPDVPMLRRGDHGRLNPMGLEARLVRPFIHGIFPPVEADLLLHDSVGRGSLDLRPFGIDAIGRLVAGHTPGSLVVLVENGAVGKSAVVGDLLRGGLMNGLLRAHVPHRHYFHEDALRAEAAAVALLDDEVTQFHVGHGGPVEAAAVRRRFARTTQD